ncbi:hypothetical protein EOM09_08220 [bacterium]|nr:hypothetical protein [bacterium]
MNELIAEQKLVYNQGISKTTYKFENGKAISCINITEFYNEEFAQIVYNANMINSHMFKNIKFNGKILEYEWSDDFFEKKGKGSSKEVIIKFLKDSGWKILNK